VAKILDVKNGEKQRVECRGIRDRFQRKKMAVFRERRGRLGREMWRSRAG
jgi:hypothetical protein